MTDLVWLRNDHLSAAINPLGAELTHLRDADGAELMTNADPAFWAKHAPILFPVIGVTNGNVIRVDGETYPMTKHGFARDMAFAVVEATPTGATFALADTAETRARYPFAFRLEIAFTLDAATLSIEARVVNPAATPLPAQFGFHPAFAWPLPYGVPRADHRIAFDRDEPVHLREVAPDGLIAAETRPSPLHGRILPLADDLFADDALVWDPVASDTVTYGATTGPHLRIAFPDTGTLGIWTKPGAAFICVEPWHGIADPKGFTGAFTDKPGVFTVAPGATKHIGMTITLER